MSIIDHLLLAVCEDLAKTGFLQLISVSASSLIHYTIKTEKILRALIFNDFEVSCLTLKILSFNFLSNATENQE